MEQPIRIALSYRANRLSATITNESDADMLVLHHPRKQPSQLELRSKEGSLRPFDTRSRKKFDATVYPADFATLTPGESMEIGDAGIERRDGDYAVQWGPFQFTELAPGSYAAKLIWVCEHSYPEDPPPAKLWIGRLESNTIDFVLD